MALWDTQSDLYSAVPVVPRIETFNSNIIGDGVSDDSVAIKAAHDAAYAAGVRVLWLSRRYYAPTAYNLGNVIFRGPGELIGTWKKRVIPMNVYPFPSFVGDIAPAKMPVFTAAASPKVAFIGDSTTVAADTISMSEFLPSMLNHAVRSQYPSKTLSVSGFGIGGSSILEYGSTGTVLSGQGFSLPSWFTTLGNTWISYVQAFAPHLLFVNWGTNNPAIHTWDRLYTLRALVKSWTPVPDIIWCPPLARGIMYEIGSTSATNGDLRDTAAATIRGFAKSKGDGLFDLHRASTAARDGYDLLRSVRTRQNSYVGTYSMPATLPITTGNFDLTFTLDNTNGTNFGPGDAILVKLSNDTNNLLWVSFLSAQFYFRGAGLGGDGDWVSGFSTGISVTSTVIEFKIEVTDQWILFSINGTLVYEGKCNRNVGDRFYPYVYYGAGGGATEINVTKYVTTSPAPVEPCMTDVEMFGSGVGGDGGGNGVNHPANACYQAVHRRIIHDIQFA